MLELAPTRACVVTCLARPDALDALSEESSFSCRVARDELLLIGPRSRAGHVEEYARAMLAELDPDGLAVDQTDGWSGWTLSGESRDEALARVSDVPLLGARPTFVQAAVAEVQGRIVACRERTHVFVVSAAGEHVRHRFLAACADLEPSVLEPAELVVEAGLVAARAAGGAR